jgi:hypothetical protein
MKLTTTFCIYTVYCTSWFVRQFAVLPISNNKYQQSPDGGTRMCPIQETFFFLSLAVTVMIFYHILNRPNLIVLNYG